MCIITQPVNSISGTNIFCADLGNGEHCTVYSMYIDTEVPTAMILPVPVRQGTGEDAVTFVNLEEYPDFFKDMSDLFPKPKTRGIASVGCAAGPLTVHNVGSFIASYVPSKKDFLRLDKQFQLPTRIWSKLPPYKGYGFAVFQLRPGNDKIHPMAYRYPAENPSEVFFPTIHVHDGEHVEEEAEFDHNLYTQETAVMKKPLMWSRSEGQVESHVKISRTKGLVGPDRFIYRRQIVGKETNADLVLVADEHNSVMKFKY